MIETPEVSLKGEGLTVSYSLRDVGPLDREGVEEQSRLYHGAKKVDRAIQAG